MKRVYSGLLRVEAFSTGSFAEIMDELERRRHNADYLVGWIDCFAKGDQLGRGLVHQANYLKPGEDPEPAQSLRIANQELPDTMFGVLPKSLLGRFLQPFNNNLGMQMINMAKFVEGDTIGNNKIELQPLAQFSFLLDYVPNWKFAYKPGGLVQFQSFIPRENAESVFRRQILLSQKCGIIPYLGVFKRHRPDAFLMTHAVDGYSLALDYPVNRKNAAGLRVLTDRLADIVVENGGRFYFAKDSLLSARSAEAFMGEDRLRKFATLKQACDPNGILETELSRRLFPELNADKTVADASVPEGTHSLAG
jgi:hypothetical protein